MSNRCWTVKALKDQIPQIDIKGEITAVSAEGFINYLSTLTGTEKIKLVIDSCGGDLKAGLSMYDALTALSVSIEAEVINAMSAASMIMCAADHISVYENSTILIHKSWLPQLEKVNADDLKLISDAVNKRDLTMASIYANRSKRDINEIMDLMAKETIFTGKQAVEFGLADEVIAGTLYGYSIEEVKAMAKEEKEKITKESSGTQAKDAVDNHDDSFREEHKAKNPEKAKKEEKKCKAEDDPEMKKDDSEDKKKEEEAKAMNDFENAKALFEFGQKANVDPALLAKAAFEDKMTVEQLAMKVAIDRANYVPKTEQTTEPEALAYVMDQLESGANNVPSTPSEISPKASAASSWEVVAKLRKEGN